MKKIQVTLTVEESKELISNNILIHPKFKQAYESGFLVLKGGTTVSRICEKVTGIPLRICGRITERGTVSSSIDSEAPHTLIYSQGVVENIDEEIVHRFSQLDQSALIVCSANAIDAQGHAVLMAGSNGGGSIGQSISSWQTEGADVLIPVGLEKLVPGNLEECVGFASRKNVEFSNGMAVGLMPLYGEIFTEIEAFKLMGDVDVRVIGSGGLQGANGSKTFLIKGDNATIDRIVDLIKLIKKTPLQESGDVESLKECAYPSSRCRSHLGCSYKSQALVEKKSKRLGVITIGQSPRNDFMQDILPLLADRFHVLECGALDPFEENEINERFSPAIGDKVLVSRLRDGSQVTFAEKYVSPLIQDAVRELENKKCDIILLMCTGKFPEIEHQSILIKPQELIPSIIDKISKNKRFGLIIPEESQKRQMYEWWGKSEDELVVHTASPYQSLETLDLAAHAMKSEDVDLIFMDCMGYTKAMKHRVEEITGKMVILPRTLIIRMINEL